MRLSILVSIVVVAIASLMLFFQEPTPENIAAVAVFIGVPAFAFARYNSITNEKLLFYTAVFSHMAIISPYPKGDAKVEFTPIDGTDRADRIANYLGLPVSTVRFIPFTFTYIGGRGTIGWVDVTGKYHRLRIPKEILKIGLVYWKSSEIVRSN